MSEVKKSDVDFITGEFEKYFQNAKLTRNFNFPDFINHMEEKFFAAGYRTPKIPDKSRGERTEILIIYDLRAGDFIMTSGAIREIRRLYPDAYINLLVSSPAFQLAELCPYVDEVMLYDPEYSQDFEKIYSEGMKFGFRFLNRRLDICYAFMHAEVTAMVCYMSGAKIRLAHRMPDEVSNNLQRNVMTLANKLTPPFDYSRHMIDIGFSLLDKNLYMPVVNRELEIWYTPVEFAGARELVKNFSHPLYALCLGGNGMYKHYPPEKYAKVLQMILAEEPTANFVLLGGGEQDLKSAEILKNEVPEIYEKNISDLTGKISFRQSAAVLKFCDMYIGNDTGNMHAAAVAKIPVLEVSCSPGDLPENPDDIIRICNPRGVPCVIVQPEHALPECAKTEPYEPYGCRVRNNEPHCIAQISPERIFKGYHILRERAEKNIDEVFYMTKD